MWNSLFWKDFAERAFFTALQTLLGIVTANGFDVVNFDVTGALVVIGVAVLGVLVKALAAKQVGGTISPASLAPTEGGI